MPRPKRTKVAPSAPAPRVKKTTKAASPALAVQKEPFNDLYDVSDAEQEVVTSARRVKKDNGKGKEVAASTPRRSRAGQNSRESESRETETLGNRLGTGRKSSKDQTEESLLPEIDLESSSPAVEVGRRERTTSAIQDSSALAIGNFKRRTRQRSILGRGPGRVRSSSVESNLAENNGLTSAGRNNRSALSNSKRRPRERSMMGRDPAPVAPSSMALEMERGTPAQVGSAMKIGAFKRREREPSILRTAQKPQPQQYLQFDNDDDDEFNPEDESTPLILSKTRNMTSSSGPSSSISRKRKLSAVQAPRSSPPQAFLEEIEAEETIPATYPSSDEEAGEEAREEAELSPGLPMPSIEARNDTPEPMSETMAPPQSSSSVLSSPSLVPQSRRAPPRGRRPLRGRTPPPRAQDSPISSPPSLTHSPNRPVHAAVASTRKPKRPAPPPSTLSTAQLQALLPRRRTRHATRGPFDIPSSEDEVDVSRLASDDDELSHLNVQARARRQASARVRTPAPVKKAAKIHKPTPKSKSKVPVKRTYGAAKASATSDKENDAEEGEVEEAEVDPDDSLAPMPDDDASPEDSQELEKRVGRELKRAARKFQEVDRWELEFEEITASSSSPTDAR
ncbi:uncharacterized protein L3040_000796 [Drepanopeziza brunnea f. sp. 'multigermtubi']|uniref:uncharacterized protein n=1 Tax=Drepanopeziza brunnea f. sp. 'multigermtubi' TaxID=698441 RepID=UPI00239CB603|nr:hypothetical protein L3040_000796 [Drepanopeziza brunnea f. sp. 'multigermtubi']